MRTILMAGVLMAGLATGAAAQCAGATGCSINGEEATACPTGCKFGAPTGRQCMVGDTRGQEHHCIPINPPAPAPAPAPAPTPTGGVSELSSLVSMALLAGWAGVRRLRKG